MPQDGLVVVAIGGGAAAAFVSGVMQIIIWKLNRRAQKEDKISCTNKYHERALRVILRDLLTRLGESHIVKGYISPEDLRDIIDMHDCYHDLKGNGLLDNIMDRVKKLPIRK